MISRQEKRGVERWRGSKQTMRVWCLSKRTRAWMVTIVSMRQGSSSCVFASMQAPDLPAWSFRLDRSRWRAGRWGVGDVQGLEGCKTITFLR